MKCRLPSEVIIHQMLSSIKGGFPTKIVFHWRSSSIKGRLPSKLLFHQMPSPSKVVFHHRSTYIICAFWGILIWRGRNYLYTNTQAFFCYIDRSLSFPFSFTPLFSTCLCAKFSGISQQILQMIWRMEKMLIFNSCAFQCISLQLYTGHGLIVSEEKPA